MCNQTNNSAHAGKCKEVDSISSIVLDWILYNVFLTFFPLILVVLVKSVARMNIELLEIVPDYLLIGFAIAITSYNYVSEYNCPPKKRKLLTAVPFILGITCLVVYFALFGDFSFVSSFLRNDISVLVKFVVCITIYLMFNIIECVVLIINTERTRRKTNLNAKCPVTK